MSTYDGAARRPSPDARPLVTVGIVTFNRCQSLRDAVLSATRQQGGVSFEVLVVDDGSSDETGSLLKSLAASEGVRFVRQEHAGLAAVRSAVVRHMRGEFLLWLDDDDALTEDAVASYAGLLSRHPDVEVAFGDLYVRAVGRPGPPYEQRYDYVNTGLLPYSLLFGNVIPNAGALTRRDIFERIGHFYQEKERGEDYDFWVRCALAGVKFVHHDHFVCHYSERAVPYYYDAVNLWVVKRNFLGAPLPQLFPMYDWRRRPAKSEAAALATLALLLYKYGDCGGALELLGRAAALSPGRRLDAFRRVCELKGAGLPADPATVAADDTYLLKTLTLERESLRGWLLRGFELA